MRLARCDGERPGWGLVDESSGARVGHIAGGLGAWASRIAGGEGCWALPLTGRFRPMLHQDEASLDPLLQRRFSLWRGRPAGVELFVGAVIGAPLAGRRNPLRSVLGYVTLTGRRCGPLLLTREEIGDAPPDGLVASEALDAVFVASMLELDEAVQLVAGDVLALGPARRDGPLLTRLLGRDLDRTPPSALSSTRAEHPSHGAAA